jgi:diadenylate cyclase
MFDLFRWHDFLDIAIVSFIIYKLLLLLVGTRAMQLVKGLIIIAFLTVGARILDMRTLSWFVGKALGVLLIAIPIVFQPELRKMLEELGRGNIWRRGRSQIRAEFLSQEILRALVSMKTQKVGALVVLQRNTGLKDFWRTAVVLNSEITQELLSTIFYPGTPLHDGAVIIDRDVLVAAACYLPLTENTDLARWIGTRHRAALGVTEVSDALALVVSEERGEIALTINGHLSRNLKDAQVYKLLLHYFGAEEPMKTSLRKRILDSLAAFWTKE